MGVDTFFPPVEPLAQDRPEAPLGQLVDEPMLFGQRDETGRFHRPQVRVVPSDQRLDAGQTALSHRHFRLVNHVQALLFERAPEACE